MAITAEVRSKFHLSRRPLDQPITVHDSVHDQWKAAIYNINFLGLQRMTLSIGDNQVENSFNLSHTGKKKLIIIMLFVCVPWLHKLVAKSSHIRVAPVLISS